ncbi:MAG TPA: SDR family oxidoreductase [Acidimicrobiales bacterium]|nr:SDR family oxidoreductase [Acidimicrobiales bacterium]
MNSFDFTGKVAIVTGAARGIGLAYAQAIAQAGAATVVADIDEDAALSAAQSIRDLGGKCIGLRVDVADPYSAETMAERSEREFGGIDMLVNNAAIFGGMKLDFLITVDWEYLQKFLSVNLCGALACTRACYKSMAERGGGAIVNQSSTAAYLYAGYYGWSKAGINSLTQQLAHELGSMNITVNAIAPGPIDTEASRQVVPDSYMKQLVGSLPMGRQGTPGDLVGMCMYLLSDYARWTTGHIFNVDGGQVFRA